MLTDAMSQKAKPGKKTVNCTTFLVYKQLAFDDLCSKLFFIFVDILNHIRSFNPDIKFLLENVRMKKEYQQVINQTLGVEPMQLNSSLGSAQGRKRLY